MTSDTCNLCDRYADVRLPLIRRVAAFEGRRFDALDESAYIAGVHERHKAGLPIFGGTS